jgi:hypothetical protein
MQIESGMTNLAPGSKESTLFRERRMASLPGRRVSKASQTAQVSAHWVKVDNPAAPAVDGSG